MIYFDNAATARFKPQCMYDAMFRELTESSNPGRASHKDAIACASRVNSARRELAALFGAGDKALVFTSGCTEALNLAILGLKDLLAGAHVAATVTEHNSVLRPLEKLREDAGVRISYAKPSDGVSVSAADVEKVLEKDTALVAVNCASNVTGALNRIDEIADLCEKKGLYLLLDGAQALGHIRIDLSRRKGVMLAAAGHKGLHGPQGSGFLIFDKDVPLSPIRFGGTGTESESPVQPKGIPEGFESGTLNAAAIAGLAASAKWTYDNFEKINARVAALSESLERGLRSLNGAKVYSSSPLGVLSFNVSGYDSTEIADYLDDNGVAVRSGLHCAPLMHSFLGTLDTGTVRMSLGYDNMPYHVERAIRLMRLFCARG